MIFKPALEVLSQVRSMWYPRLIVLAVQDLPNVVTKTDKLQIRRKYCQSEIILGGSWFPVRDSRSCVSNKASSPRSDGPGESSPVQLSIKRLCSQSGLLWPGHPKPGSKRLIDKVPKDLDVVWTIPCYILMRGRYVHMLWLIATNLLFNPRHNISQTLCRNQIEPYLSLSINSTIKIAQI